MSFRHILVTQELLRTALLRYFVQEGWSLWGAPKLTRGPWKWAPLLTLWTAPRPHPSVSILLLVHFSLFNRYILSPECVLALEDTGA